MLNQLEFKLRVEKEYMAGIEKMAKLYQVGGLPTGRYPASCSDFKAIIVRRSRATRRRATMQRQRGSRARGRRTSWRQL